MQIFDYVIMGVGGVLILIGVMLFISGKKESANQNEVQGFGIRLNVSNPSIILIVLGIGLILVPRLLPHQPGQPDIGVKPAAQDSAPQRITNKQARRPLPTEQLQQQPIEAQQRPAPKRLQDSISLFPPGEWQLDDYELNGIDISMSTDAQMTISALSSTRSRWHSTFSLQDMWGNQVTYSYTGSVWQKDAQYWLRIENTDDPSFTGQLETPVELLIEGHRLHMRYSLLGNNILLHWRPR